jgi:uncharacterized repeat protein (TIGR03803 family)
MIRGMSGRIAAVCALAIASWMFPAEAAQITPIYQFKGISGGNNDGAYPVASLISDSNGNLYGTTAGGGTGCKIGCGTVFKLSQSGGSWTESLLYAFKGPPGDGAVPVAGLMFDQAGNLYGNTSQGGGPGCNGFGCGTVFKFSQSNGSWTESILYSFKGGSDGQDPRASLIMDASGNLYGTG